MLILSLIIIFITAIVLFLRSWFTFWSRQGVKGSSFIDFQMFLTQQFKFTTNMQKKYGKIFGGYGLTNRYLVINEPDLIREVLVKNTHIFADHKLINMGPDPNVNNILFFLSSNEKWKRIRSTITPAFTSGKLKAMMSHISVIADKLVSNLEKFEQKDEMVDIRKYIGGFTMDVICACAYGINIDSINNPEHPVVLNAKKILNVNANLSTILSVTAPEFASFLKLSLLDIEGTNFFIDLTNKIVAERKKINQIKTTEKGNKTSDFIQLMIDSEKPDSVFETNSKEEEPGKSFKPSGALTQYELTAQGISFFLAGYDTTSAALSHLVYYLAQNKECQQRLYEELKYVEEFTHDSISQLKYLNACIDETIRLAPPLLIVERNTEQDFNLAGINIPKGTTVDIWPYNLHRDPDYWPEPLNFKPDRFINPTHHPYAYLPFGGGHRMCIGQRFALTEIRICGAKLFKKFEFSIASGYEELDYFKGLVVLSPKTVMVNLKTR